MIRIDLGPESSPGLWDYSIPSLALFGKSRQPLLDACRQIKLAVGATAERAGLFRNGRDVADLSCPVSCGAYFTVSEPDKGMIGFAKYRAFDLKKELAA